MRLLAYSLSSLFLLLYLLYLHEMASELTSILNVVDTTQFIRHNAVDPPCALFFYGLAKRVDLTLPSTFSKVINKNPECTVIYQTQNVTYTSTPHALWDSESGVINYDALYVHESPTFKIILTGGDTGESKSFPSLPFLLSKCCAPGYTDTSMSNLHKSWESLETLLPFIDDYETVGIFRNDVMFIDEVDIFSSDFAIPKWGSFKGFNDRMFYGTKENALKWAGRFDRLRGERNIWVSLRYVRWGV